ncbi:MAG TPA: hypothetical protein VGD60_01560 [Candidatus Acidoferrales bacterium]
MNSPQPQIDSLQACGYTDEEARFLYLVATHSGFFVARQFLGFTGAHWGKRTTLFWNKLQSRHHARTCRFAEGGTVYHLFSRKIYRQIGRENLRNRRDHEFEYVRTRIATLDFVLGNLNLDYLETEPDKVAYFCSELNVRAHYLPSRTYSGRYTVKPTVRYFLDRFPMFCTAEPTALRNVTFTYLQGPESNLSGFVHHLQGYLLLFRELSRFQFLFVARSDAHFRKAGELFRDLVTIPLEANPSEDLLRYFAIRKAWDLAKYTSLTEGDLIFRNLAKERFAGPRFEHSYRAWKVGRLSDAEIREDLRGSDKPHSVCFETRLLPAVGAHDRELRENR